MRALAGLKRGVCARVNGWPLNSLLTDGDRVISAMETAEHREVWKVSGSLWLRELESEDAGPATV